MHRDEIDGVRIVYRDVPGDYHGTLVFGVGARDEGIDQIGLSRFVIELVVDAVSTEADFGSGMLDTMIVASGEPEDVAAHFSECCDALGRAVSVAGLISPVLDRAVLHPTGRLGTPRVRRHRLSD